MLLQTAIDTLSETTSTPPDASPSNPVHQFAYSALSHLWTTLKKAQAERIRSNVMVASMFIKYLMDGHLDLPPTLNEFYEIVCGDASLVPSSWGREKQAIQRLRLPLQISLALSPLCLLLPTNLALKDMARERLMTVRPISLTMPVVAYPPCHFRLGSTWEISGPPRSVLPKIPCGSSSSH